EPGHDQTEDPDGNVDVEDRLPRDVLDEIAAHDRSDGDGEARDGRPDPDGRAALVALEGGRDDRQGAGQQKGRPQALDGPEADQLTGALGQGTGQGSQGEQAEAAHEEPLAAVEVARGPSRE